MLYWVDWCLSGGFVKKSLIMYYLLPSITDSHGLADMNSSIHEVVVDHAVQHPHVPPGDVVLTGMAVLRQSWAIVGCEVLHDVLGGVLDHVAKPVHLVCALVAGEPGVRSCKGGGDTKENKSKGSLHDDW